ncbi:Oxidoreductase [Polyrhizophydium stewartii]|uniref:Mitochondrial intermembrane space import and assembly protein 40 n=1 Tax=Polyrhizophydium stewartii TaxID=2732419 RepID=A0ABR4NH68_9FUNG
MSYARVDEEKDVIFFVTPDQPAAAKTEASAGSAPAAADTAGQAQQAYNEETGEINWDCPCLGPMTQPPCGDVFKEAFSCFVYSKEEPKGMDCVEQFRAMQSCFREHPEIYGDDEDDDDARDGTDAASRK